MKFHSPENFSAFSLGRIAEYGEKKRNTILSRFDIEDPTNLEEAIGKGAYRAFVELLLHPEIGEKIRSKAITDRQSQSLLLEKLEQIAGISSPDKVLVISLADHDPETFFGKTIAEKNPHLIVESILIAARIAKVEEAMIYIDERDREAAEILKKALLDAREIGLVGERILGIDFSLNIRIRIGMRNFVHMDDSAFKASLHGRRAEPVYLDLYPHTFIFPSEALIQLPIARETEDDEIPALFALTGQITRAGISEYTSETTLRTIIEQAGGIKDKKEFKAALIGDTFFDGNELDVDILRVEKSRFQDGNITFFDANDCIVSRLRFTLGSLYEETCGKCTPCRIGIKRILEALDLLIGGKGSEEDVRRIRELSLYVRQTSLCALGKKSAGIVLSALEKFEGEFLAHADKKCPAGSCKALVQYRIVTPNCLGCGMCARNCPVNAIFKTDLFGKNPRLNAFAIDAKKCVKCGTCLAKCPAKPKAIVR